VEGHKSTPSRGHEMMATRVTSGRNRNYNTTHSPQHSPVSPTFSNFGRHSSTLRRLQNDLKSDISMLAKTNHVEVHGFSYGKTRPTNTGQGNTHSPKCVTHLCKLTLWNCPQHWSFVKYAIAYEPPHRPEAVRQRLSLSTKSIPKVLKPSISPPDTPC
jgi:hypothetical protein